MSFKSLVANGMVAVLPNPVLRYVGALYGYLKRPSKSYSLYGEDLVINHLFDHLGIKSGIYVDIGAFHPKWISNTYLLSKKDWRGVVVDLEKAKLNFFHFLRPNCTPICAAVSVDPQKEDIKYYSFDRLLSEWDTISSEEAEMRKNKSGINYSEHIVRTIGINCVLDTAIEKYGASVDYLNIDIEGVDEAILYDLDFQKYAVKCIQFENNIFFKGSKTVRDLLSLKGYMHYATMGGTHTYVLKSLLNIDENEKKDPP